MDEKIEQKDSMKLTVMYTLIVFSLATIAVLAVIYFVEPEEIPEGSFLNPLPDEDKTNAFTGELTYEPEPEPEPEPVIINELMIDFINDLKASEASELTQEEEEIEMPQTVLDMSRFIAGYPDLSTQENHILMAYAVGQERGITDETIDAEARIIMAKLLQ